jgi:chromosome segregation ATPase
MIRYITSASDPHFTTAVRAGLGRHHNSLVVRDGAAARRATEVLETQRAGTSTFVPADMRVDTGLVNQLRRTSHAGVFMLVKVQGGDGVKSLGVRKNTFARSQAVKYESRD